MAMITITLTEFYIRDWVYVHNSLKPLLTCLMAYYVATSGTIYQM
jgi:hypothetical protein